MEITIKISEHIFYALLVIPFIYEVYTLVNFSYVNSLYAGKKIYNSLVRDVIVIYFLIIAVGLFTSQWFLFLILLGLSMIPKKHKRIHFLDAIVSLALLVFIVVNKYYLHISF